MAITQVMVTSVLIQILTAVAFLLVVSFSIGYTSKTVRKTLSHKFEEETILDLFESTTRGLLWFSAALMTLSILGFEGIATSLGTAAGFVALGVSFALKNVLSDTVAGIYLANDQDFNNGDKVLVDGSKGKVTDVGLRKSRLKLENGNTRIINNSDVEKKWTKIS